MKDRISFYSRLQVTRVVFIRWRLKAEMLVYVEVLMAKQDPIGQDSMSGSMKSD